MNEGSILISPALSLPFMTALYSWGIAVITHIQSIASPGLTVFMKALSSLASTYFYVPFVLFVFWCLDEKKGFRLGLLIIVSTWLNLCLKELFNQPRPFEFDPALAFEESRAFPSGHAQTSFTFWVSLAFNLAKGKKLRPLVWAVSVFFILIIGFTQLYLGLHFPTDILGGWIAGALVLALFYFLEKPVSQVFLKTGKRPQLISAAGAALLMNALHPADIRLSAMLLGFCGGYSLMLKGFPFSAPPDGKKPWIQVLAPRIAIGFSAAGVIFLASRLMLPGNDSLWQGIPFLEGFYRVGGFLRYGLLGLWASAGAPRVFQHLGITAQPEEA